MHHVFLYPSPGIWGGIETMILRMTHWLVARGHQVTIITVSDLAWGASLPPDVRCISLGSRFWKLSYYFHTRRLWHSLNIPQPDVIKGFSWEFRTAWIAYQLAVITGAKALIGFYGPVPTLKYGGRFYLRNVHRNLSVCARIFMSPEQIDIYQDTYGQGGRLWLLPVDSDRFVPATRRPKWGRIVSIGRLSDMKGYNFYMIDVVHELIRRGHAVTWTVHGTGEYEPEMRKMIQARGLEDVIDLAGEMPYERCHLELAEAYVFVGMGTSIIEASLFGVPNVLAQVYDRDGVTYGPIYRVPLGSVGDVRDDTEVLPVVDEIERILMLSSSAYGAEAEAVRSYARPYDSDTSMEQFLELVDSAPVPSARVWPCVENYMHVLYRMLKLLLQRASCMAQAAR